MSKHYNISKKSDMRRFTRDIERDIYKAAENAIRAKGVELECPDCHQQVTFRQGENICPLCGHEVDINFNFHWS